ncbi:MAG: efflux RND transporter permease subunit [Acidobacteriota bacterium]|nr:efflux RND transporter permease subunit [Acidobacteriota bacterium]
MLNAIVRFSLRFRGVVLALALAFLGYGIYSLTQASFSVFPEFAPPFVTIQTESPGLSPEQVELLVTQPVENAVNGTTGIELLRSTSIQGLSVISVVFRNDSDIYRDRQLVAERLATVAGQLPQGVSPPTMTPLQSSTGTVLVMGLTPDRRSPAPSLMDLRTVADWTLKPRLLAVPGVASISVFGGEVRQLQVQFLPEKLVQYNLSLDDVVAAAQKATAVVGAGFVSDGNQRFILRPEGQPVTPEQIAATVLVRQNGANVTLGQVADVREGEAPPFSAALVDGKPGVIVNIYAQYGSNIIQVTRNVEQALHDLNPALQREGIAVHPDLFRPVNFINTSIHNIRNSLYLGAALVLVVLFLFLFDLRTAAISCTAIPLSLLAAITVMDKMGFALNTMTLGGLAIAIGEVVDDAVIDVENILRRLRLNAAGENPRPVFEVVLGASLEVRSAVVYATFAVALIFMPVLTLSGLAGRIFAPLGIAYILSILASLLVALTVTPALSMILLTHRRLRAFEPPLVHWLKARYIAVLEQIERAPRLVIGLTALATAGGLATLPFLSTSFLPELHEGHYIVHMISVPGSSLAESLRRGRQVTAALEKLPFVRSVGQRVGRASLDEDTWGPYYSEIEVDLKPMGGDAEEAAQARIRKTLARFSGLSFSMNTFLTERIEETLSGYGASVVADIYGTNLDQLDQEAVQVARVLHSVPGATDVEMQAPPGTPEIAVDLRAPALQHWGFDPVSVLQDIHTAYEGEQVGDVYEGNRIFPVDVILPPALRSRVDAVAQLPLRNPEGIYVPLGQLAGVYETSGRYAVLHDGARRVQTITLNVAGGDAQAFVRNAQRQIAAKVKLAPGDYVQFSGTAEAEAQSRRDLLAHASLAGLGIVLLLSVVLMNWRNLLLVLVNLPFALVGGVLAVFAHGGMLSLGAMVGFVTLFGITVRNSIMLITHYEHLVTVEGREWGYRTAIDGASERLAPILMTALVTALGLLPLAIGSNTPGQEIEGPLAIVILGGLFTSTALNLLVLPTLSLRFGRFHKPSPPQSATQ